MYLFGGKGANIDESFNDSWIFNLVELTWSKVAYSNTNVLPIPRSGHSTVFDNDTT